MEEFRKKIKRKVIISTIFCMSGLFIYFILIRITGAPDYARGILSGAFGGTEVVAVFYIFKLMPLLQDEEKLKQAYITETDERNTLIQKETAKTSSTILVMVLSLAAIVAGFFDPVVSMTLAFVIILAGIISVAVTAYYNKKM
ncbi:MAG: hypothetical protein IJM38_08945 [Ruminococcus sp.]|nr:hypothetical protein [Ruminococcus sp.]